MHAAVEVAAAVTKLAVGMREDAEVLAAGQVAAADVVAAVLAASTVRTPHKCEHTDAQPRAACTGPWPAYHCRNQVFGSGPQYHHSQRALLEPVMVEVDVTAARRPASRPNLCPLQRRLDG